MTTEEMIFASRRFIPEAAEQSGFTKCDGGWLYEEELCGGDFLASVLVSKDGTVTGRVIDRMNDEEYEPLRNMSYQGAYVGAVRTAYDELLRRIAEDCFREVLFSSDQSNRITAQIKESFGVEPDFPFDEDPHLKSGVFRHADNAKWFALLMNIRRGVLTKDGDESRCDAVNLKAAPDGIPALTQKDGIYPAYHMNHKHWISVVLDDTLTDGDIMSLIAASFELTEKKALKKRRVKE